MAQLKTIARRYAKGLYEACSPSELAKLRDSFSALADLITSNPPVISMIKNPAISETDKTAALIALSEKVMGGTGNSLISNLIKTLVQNGRGSIIADVSECFSEIVHRHFKMSQVRISSAREIAADERNSYESTLKQHLGPQANVAFDVDPELLGGMQVHLGDVLIDGSVRNSLQQLRAALVN